ASSVTLVTQSGLTQSGPTQSSPGSEDPIAIQGFTVIQGRIVALEGTAGLEAVMVEPVARAPQRLPTQAVFVQSARRPALGFAPAALARDAEGRLVTDAALQCSMPRLFAAGD